MAGVYCSPVHWIVHPYAVHPMCQSLCIRRYCESLGFVEYRCAAYTDQLPERNAAFGTRCVQWTVPSVRWARMDDRSCCGTR